MLYECKVSLIGRNACSAFEGIQYRIFVSKKEYTSIIDEYIKKQRTKRFLSNMLNVWRITLEEITIFQCGTTCLDGLATLLCFWFTILEIPILKLNSHWSCAVSMSMYLNTNDFCSKIPYIGSEKNDKCALSHRQIWINFTMNSVNANVHWSDAMTIFRSESRIPWLHFLPCAYENCSPPENVDILCVSSMHGNAFALIICWQVNNFQFISNLRWTNE